MVGRRKRYLKEVQLALAIHLGGPERMSVPQRILVERVAIDMLRLNTPIVDWLIGAVADNDVGEVAAVVVLRTPDGRMIVVDALASDYSRLDDFCETLFGIIDALALRCRVRKGASVWCRSGELLDRIGQNLRIPLPEQVEIDGGNEGLTTEEFRETGHCQHPDDNCRIRQDRGTKNTIPVHPKVGLDALGAGG